MAYETIALVGIPASRSDRCTTRSAKVASEVVAKLLTPSRDSIETDSPGMAVGGLDPPRREADG